MKKMLLATALALLITGCAQQTFTVQNKQTAVAPKETITHHFFVSGIGQKKTVDAAKICGGTENVVKTETQQTFVNGLLGFITLGIYTPLEARVYCSQYLHELPIDMGNSICTAH
ncbi:Bor-like outer membrane protein [Escherichia phage Min27]|nr:Bor-like outer membrane protein [Escherichia phage Min27]ABY49903.1 Bor protein precursor [Escherichia phage Min27]